MKKLKVLSSLLVLGMGATALASCGGKTTPAPSTTPGTSVITTPADVITEEELEAAKQQAAQEAAAKAALEAAKTAAIANVENFAEQTMKLAGMTSSAEITAIIEAVAKEVQTATTADVVNAKVDAAIDSISDIVAAKLAGKDQAHEEEKENLQLIVGALEENRIALTNEVADLKGQLSTANNNIAELEAKIAEKEDAIKALDAEIADLKAQLDVYEKDARLMAIKDVIEFYYSSKPSHAPEDDGSVALIIGQFTFYTFGVKEEELPGLTTAAKEEIAERWDALFEASFVEITTAEELLAMRFDYVENASAKNYRLAADIDLSGYDIAPLDSNSYVYSGYFDGNGHTIKNAAVECTTAKTGFLFGTLKNAVVTNVRFDAITVTGGSTESHAVVAGLINGKSTLSNVEFTSCMVKTGGNYAALGVSRNDGASAELTFKNITVKNSCSVSGNKYSGLLLGDMVATSKASFEDLDISANISNAGGQLGAVAGRVRGGDISFKNIIMREVAASTESNKTGLFFDGASACNSVTFENIVLVQASVTAAKQSSLLDGGNSASKTTTYTNLFAVDAVCTLNGTEQALPESLTVITPETLTEAWYTETLGLSKEVWEWDGETMKIKGTSPNRPSEGATLEELTLVTAGAKTAFLKNEDFSAAGLVVKAKYSDGVQIALKGDDFEIDSSAYNKEAAGKYTIVVKVGEKTASYDVFVNQIETIEIDELTVDNLLLSTETFSSTGLVVIGTMTDGTKVSLTEGLTFENAPTLAEGATTLTPGAYNVVVGYEGGLTDTYVVTVVGTTLTEENSNVQVVANYTGVDGTLEEGVATFGSIQAAIDYVESSNLDAVTKKIFIGEGTFFEKLTISDPYIQLIGEGQDKTIIEHNRAAGHKLPSLSGTWGTDGSATVTVKGSAVGFYAQGIMFVNSYDYFSNEVADAQALAILCSADQAVFYQCGFTSYQDTLETKGGRQLFDSCYVAGAVDFIFGTNSTTVFQNCEIKSLDRRNATNAGYICAPQGCYGTAGTQTVEYGFIFLNCRLTAEEGVVDGTVGLARPWRTDAMCAYINCEMGAHVSTAEYPGTTQSRWEEMNGDSPAVARFYEYGTTGAGAITEAVVGGKILTAEEAALYTFENIFAATNGMVTYDAAWDGKIPGAQAATTQVDQYIFGTSATEVAAHNVYTMEGELNGAAGTLGELALDGTTGKIQARGGDSQCNEGATITLVASHNGTLTITNHSGYHNYTINDVAAEADSNTIELVAGQTYVIKMTATSYIWSIVVSYDLE